MKASELISHLNEIKDYAGDIDVCVIDITTPPISICGDVGIQHNPKRNRIEFYLHTNWTATTDCASYEWKDED